MIRTLLLSLSISAGLSACAATSTVKTSSNSVADTLNEAAATTKLIPPAPQFSQHSGISSKDFSTTLADLQAALEAKGFKIFAVVDHAKGAASVGVTLEATTTIIFGNPKGGTQLMLADRTVGLDLPLKALIYEDAGTVYVVMQDLSALTARYNLQSKAPVLGKVDKALAGLLVAATAK